jgi:adenylate kinase
MSLNKILLIGMPGAGKGTQAKLLSQDFNLSILGTGAIIREAWKNKDPLISPYKESIEKGGFLPDELTFQLITKSIENISQESAGYILDGAVRNLNQARFVLSHKLVNLIIEFNLPINLAKERIGERRLKEDRKDDSLEAVDRRFFEYYNQTFTAMDFLRENSNYSLKNTPMLYHLDASRHAEEVHKELFDFIKKYF